MTNYSFASVVLNNKHVALRSISDGAAMGQTPFEQDTLSFIRQWIAGDEFFVIPTSGSTGTPKLIEVSRKQFNTSAAMTIEALRLKKGGRALVCLPTRYIAGRMMIVRAFENDMEMIIEEPSSTPSFHGDFSLAAMVPLQAHQLLATEKGQIILRAIQNILIGGGSVTRGLQLELQRKVATKVYQTFGMTETLSHIALQLITTEYRQEDFTVLPGVIIRTDERGCLVVQTPYHASEIVTNDLVELTSANSFKWLGRWDNLINSGGIKVVPELLEKDIVEIFQTHNITNPFFIFTEPDAILGDKIMLAIEGILTSGTDNILEILKQNLPPHVAPKQVRSVQRFAYTVTGKINRRATINYL